MTSKKYDNLLKGTAISLCLAFASGCATTQDDNLADIDQTNAHASTEKKSGFDGALERSKKTLEQDTLSTSLPKNCITVKNEDGQDIILSCPIIPPIKGYEL